MNEFSKYVGLDVHKETIAVSVAEAGGGEVRYFGEIANTPEAVAKLARQLGKGDSRLSFCYEAGGVRVRGVSAIARTQARLRGGGALVNSEESGGSGKDRSAR
jgi:hypothetical protein